MRLYLLCEFASTYLCYPTVKKRIRNFMMPPKIPMCLTLNEKALIIQELKTGASVTHLSKKYGVAKSTICKIKNKAEIILRAVSCTYTGPGKRRTLKESNHPEMEKKLYKWFLNKRKKNVIVSGDVIKEKAKALHSNIKGNVNKEFNASDGWLQRFKKRFGIRYLKTKREKLSSQPELVDIFKVELKNKIEQLGITLDQLYNADESALYWKLLPEKTFVSIQEERLTFLGCINASGNHKVKPLVIGKIKNPKAFSLPVDYNNSETALMTESIFMNWFHHSFIPQVTQFLKSKGLPVKALLLLSNAPSRPPEDKLQSEDGQIITMYIPPNVTALIQPMDQNVIKLTKLYYRCSLLQNIIANGADIGILKDLTLKDAVINLMSAWNRLDPEIIAKCWKKLLDFSDQDGKNDLVLDKIERNWKERQTAAITESRDFLNMLIPQIEFTVTDVINWNEADAPVENMNEDRNENQTEDTQKTITPENAINALDTTIQWAIETGIGYDYIQSLKELREKALMQKVNNNEKQIKILDY